MTPTSTGLQTPTEHSTDPTTDPCREEAVADLIAAVQGPVFLPDSPGYAEEIAGFNLAHQPRPAVVVGVTDTQDVARAVAWATATGRTVRVQATGHGLADDLAGCLLLSTRRLDALAVDPVAGTARIGAGVRWREVTDAAAPFGLAPLSGSASSVGAVGYTLGGGIGVLSRRFGFAADHVRSLVMVTAEGRVRRVDAEREPELFWAVRGGKVGFGVVTEMVIDLVPVPTLHAGGIFFDGADARTVLHAWRRWVPTLPRETSTSVALLRLPPDPSLPPFLQGRFVTHLRFAHQGSAAAGAALLAEIRAVRPALLDTVADLPYQAADAIHGDPTQPLPCYDRGATLTGLPAPAVDALVDAQATADAVTMVEVRLLGGALADPAPVANAVAGRSAAFSVYVLGVPAGPAGAVVPGQVDGVVNVVAPWRDGGLVNFVGHGGRPDRRGLWAETDRARLRDVATREDPRNVFGGRDWFG